MFGITELDFVKFGMGELDFVINMLQEMIESHTFFFVMRLMYYIFL